MKTQNYNDYFYFSFIAKNPSYGFATYKDPNTGQVCGYVEGYDKNGQPLYKYWRFNYDSQRIKRVSKDERDLKKTPEYPNGQLAHEFLRSAPACMGSENGEYVQGTQTGYFFKEVNTAKDAKEAVDTRRNLIQAQAIALGLKGQELEDIANYIGVFDPSEDVKVHRVLDFSSNQPTKFLELVNDKTIKVRSFLRRAVNAGILKEDGRMITWESRTIGADEDEAVAALMKDDKLKKAIEVHLTKIA